MKFICLFIINFCYFLTFDQIFISFFFISIFTSSSSSLWYKQADPLSVIGIFPGLLPPHSIGCEAFPPLELTGPQRDRAVKALGNFLCKNRGTVRTENDTIRNARREAIEEAEKMTLESETDGKCNVDKAQATLQQLSTLGLNISGLNFGEGEESQVKEVFEALKDRADGLLDEQQRLPYAECTDPLVILDTTLLKVFFLSLSFLIIYNFHR